MRDGRKDWKRRKEEVYSAEREEVGRESEDKVETKSFYLFFLLETLLNR